MNTRRRFKAIKIITKLPKVPAEWLALLLHIREAQGSNRDPETAYPDKYFPQPLQANARIVP
jgi:hypothetical protein